MDLLTSQDSREQLIDEQVDRVKLELFEGTGAKTGRVFARGEFGHASKPTANGRLYRPAIWESNIGRLQANLKSRKVLGELDHPTDGRTALQRASHIITDLRLDGDRVMGEAEILDTAKGRDLKAILAAGVPVGISSRGYGSTKQNAKGQDVVQEDYKLVTFDFVAEPADDTAYPEAFFEGVEFPMDTMTKEDEKRLSKKFAEKVIAARKEGEESTEATLRQEFAAELLSKLGAMRSDLKDEVRAEMLADPEIAGAKDAMETVRQALRPYVLPDDVNAIVEEKDVEIRRLRKQLAEAELKLGSQDELIEKLKNAAKEAGYKYHMEHLLQGDDEVELIRQIVGDVTLYENPKALESKIEEARGEITLRRREEDRIRKRLTAREDRVKNKNRELAEGLEEALTVNRDLALRLYAAERLQTHPQGARIKRMLDRVGYDSKEQVDDLIEDWREPARDADDLETVRNRVRAKLGGGREYLQEDERPPANGGGNYNNLGVSLAELKHLARIEDDN